MIASENSNGGNGGTLNSNPTLLLILGTLFIIGGLFAIGYPLAVSGGIVLLLGWILFLGGIFKFLNAISTSKQTGFSWRIISSILYVLAGISILKNPMVGALSIVIIVGMFFIIEGIAEASFASEMKPNEGWDFLMFSGILTILFGILILFVFPKATLVFIGILVGIKMIFAGWDLISLSRRLKKVESK
ncbi:MAG: HdeD family acid-resistance protein [Candidatus Kariarchaeaceae archaeon]|jgi:uncharacterized membrane protein HdeD (DUF308 family)